MTMNRSLIHQYIDFIITTNRHTFSAVLIDAASSE